MTIRVGQDVVDELAAQKAAGARGGVPLTTACPTCKGQLVANGVFTGGRIMNARQIRSFKIVALCADGCGGEFDTDRSFEID